MINLNATLLIQLANFLLLMYLLNRLLFRPMVRILEERRARTEGRRKQAAQLDAEAEGIWSDYQKRMQEARTEADKVRTDLVRQAEVERQKNLEKAAAQAEKMVTEIRARVRAEAEEARKALTAESQRLGGDLAQRLLGRSI